MAYALRGEPGATVVQQVTVRLRYRCGEHVLVEYRGRYAEYFRLGAAGDLGTLADGSVQQDVHDFDLRRDGWCAMGVRRLVRDLGLRDATGRRCPREREGAFESRKQFLVGLGEVEGARPTQRTPDGGAFGFLACGPQGRSTARMVLACCRGGAPLEVTLAPPVPWPGAELGTGRFSVEAGWATTEDYRYSYGLQAGRLVSAGYVPARLDDALALTVEGTS